MIQPYATQNSLSVKRHKCVERHREICRVSISNLKSETEMLQNSSAAEHTWYHKYKTLYLTSSRGTQKHTENGLCGCE